MDEPFSALDILTADNLRFELLDLWLCRLQRESTLIVTHCVVNACGFTIIADIENTAAKFAKIMMINWKLKPTLIFSQLRQLKPGSERWKTVILLRVFPYNHWYYYGYW